MFSTKVHDRKAFGAEQKISEPQKRISKLKRIKSTFNVITPTMPITKSTGNVHQTESEKYGYPPNYIEKNLNSAKKSGQNLTLSELKNRNKLQKESTNSIKNCMRKMEDLLSMEKSFKNKGLRINAHIYKIEDKNKTAEFYDYFHHLKTLFSLERWLYILRGKVIF